MNQLTRKDLELHIPIVGWLFIICSALLLTIGIIGFFFLTSFGVVANDPQAALVLGTIGMWGGIFFFVLALPGFLAGYGLLQHKEWGRILAIVVAFLNLLNFPLGTLLGLYTLWVLLQTSANEYFAPPPLPVPA
ncbi:MAG: hypothetical protein EYC68_11160 [Chloroflexota bacterium]|nr:MAG: hypothetical protein EYC68_11160 [Chloroflexota bacterium]